MKMKKIPLICLLASTALAGDALARGGLAGSLDDLFSGSDSASSTD
jgi:hypothetical protein